MDLREVWPYEANNFAPWLAENLSHLQRRLASLWNWRELK